MTHTVNGTSNVVNVDYDKCTVTVKRVPCTSTLMKFLLQSGKIRKCYSELQDDYDVWLMKDKLRGGWVSVSCDGCVRNTLNSKLFEGDDAAFLTSFVELPVWSNKSKVFVLKLLYTGDKVSLRKYIKAAGKLPPKIAGSFARMYAIQAPENDDAVSQIEIWGHTLNVLYGSNMELLDPYLLCELNWLQPLVCRDTVLWRGMSEAHGRTLYVYLKGDAVLYVGYNTLREVEFNRYSIPREVSEVVTFENLLSQTCVGLLEVFGSYLMWDTAKNRKVKICNELVAKDIENRLAEFLFESMVLVDIGWDKLPNGVSVQNSWLYDVVNDKIYVFKCYGSDKLGTYYGELTVEEWRERIARRT